jgi:arylsulfatase A-like enzyme
MFDKRFMYEAAIHIPLLIRHPLEVAPSSVSDDFVVNIDFAETLLDHAGPNPLPGAQGRSMRLILRGESTAGLEK